MIIKCLKREPIYFSTLVHLGLSYIHVLLQLSSTILQAILSHAYVSFSSSLGTSGYILTFYATTLTLSHTHTKQKVNLKMRNMGKHARFISGLQNNWNLLRTNLPPEFLTIKYQMPKVYPHFSYSYSPSHNSR